MEKIENKEEYAKQLAARAEKCVKLLKRFAISALVLVGVLAVFTVILFIVNACAESRETLIYCTTVGAVGFIVLVACIAALLVAVICTYVVARVNLNRLGALDKD